MSDFLESVCERQSLNTCHKWCMGNVCNGMIRNGEWSISSDMYIVSLV